MTPSVWLGTSWASSSFAASITAVRSGGSSRPRRIWALTTLLPTRLAAAPRATEVMFGPPGHAYVYLIYGMYHCLNVVTGPGDHASAVLLRALEPVSNIDISASGPGRLCRALDIDRRLNGHDLTTGELVLAEPADLAGHFAIEARPRVGVDYSGEWAHKPLRFCIAGNRFISRT